MKEFKIKVTQPLGGFYKGIIKLEAKNKKDFIKQLNEMSSGDLESIGEWRHGDNYWTNGDVELQLDTIEEI